jgi:hypothetical protein
VEINKQERKFTLQSRNADNPAKVEERAEGEVKANKRNRGEQSGNNL